MVPPSVELLGEADRQPIPQVLRGYPLAPDHVPNPVVTACSPARRPWLVPLHGDRQPFALEHAFDIGMPRDRKHGCGAGVGRQRWERRPMWMTSTVISVSLTSYRTR
jgi:hypothetical protein